MSSHIDPPSTSRSVRRNRFQRHAVITTIITVVLVVFLCDVSAASVFWKIAGYPWPQRAFEKQKNIERKYRIRSPFYHHDLAPYTAMDNATFGTRTYRIRTNSLGFKDNSTRTVPLTSDRHRLLFIGDSMTEGIGVEYPSTFVGRIDKTLSAENIEVLNAAAASYCPIIYWTKLKYLLETRGLKVDEVMVFIDESDDWDDLSYGIDAKGAVVSQIAEEDRKGILGAFANNRRPLLDAVRDFVRDRTILTASVVRLIWSRGGFQRTETIDLKGAWTYDPQVFEAFGRRGLERMKENMEHLRVLLEAHHVRLLVGVYPWPLQIQHNDLMSVQVEFWQKWCNEHQIPFLNLFPAFVKQNPEEKEKILAEDFLVSDNHWNEHGHEVVARNFLEFYRGIHQVGRVQPRQPARRFTANAYLSKLELGRPNGPAH